MASYNRVVLIGNLTRDPEYKQLPSGQAVTRLGLAVNRQYKNKQTSAMVQEVCFIDIDVFGPQAESCRQYLQKGRPVLIEGRLKFDTWQSPEGQTRSKHSVVADRVVFLGSAQASTELEAELDAQAIPPVSSDPAVLAAESMLGKVKGKKQRASQGVPATDTGEFAFKDEPPFQDDLPF